LRQAGPVRQTRRVDVVLITGMSGAGKSTALVGLVDRGFTAVDTDVPGWIEVVDGERLWREDRILELLDEPRSGPLFLSGTVANQGRFRDRFDAIVLLTAPLDVLLERLGTRVTNDFGKTEAERAAVVRDHREVEPILRSVATHVIDTTDPEDEVVDALEALVSRSAAST
jgi:RNase adaptor protein for sRNA GlmZ degradation